MIYHQWSFTTFFFQISSTGCSVWAWFRFACVQHLLKLLGNPDSFGFVLNLERGRSQWICGSQTKSSVKLLVCFHWSPFSGRFKSQVKGFSFPPSGWPRWNAPTAPCPPTAALPRAACKSLLTPSTGLFLADASQFGPLTSSSQW